MNHDLQDLKDLLGNKGANLGSLFLFLYIKQG